MGQTRREGDWPIRSCGIGRRKLRSLRFCRARECLPDLIAMAGVTAVLTGKRQAIAESALTGSPGGEGHDA